MSPFKSSLAKTAKQLLGLRNTADLGLRGATQTSRREAPILTYDTLVVMVAGGGAGGGGANGADGGGGGGGEVKFGPLTLQSAASYVFRVGDGGPGPGNNTPTGENGTGTPSFISSPLFTTVTAQGGGGGGTGGSNVPPNGGYGAPGGSGGGGGGDGASPGDHDQPGGTSTAAPATDPDYYSFNAFGFAGGLGGEDGGGGGGGGGAGEPGADGTARDGVSGKRLDDFPYPLIEPAVPSPLRPTVGPQIGPLSYFGGGGCQGGEGTEPANRSPSGGGGGGGGNSGNPGTELTGGGGAGRESDNPGGNGGCGVIIMRIPASNAPVVNVPGGVTSATPGNGYKYFLFSGVSTTSYPVSVNPG